MTILRLEILCSFAFFNEKIAIGESLRVSTTPKKKNCSWRPAIQGKTCAWLIWKQNPHQIKSVEKPRFYPLVNSHGWLKRWTFWSGIPWIFPFSILVYRTVDIPSYEEVFVWMFTTNLHHYPAPLAEHMNLRDIVYRSRGIRMVGCAGSPQRTVPPLETG